MVQVGTQLRDSLEVLKDLTYQSPNQAAAWLFESITGVDSDDLDAIFSTQAVVPHSVSARQLRDNLAELLGISKATAAELLDTTPSRLSRSDHVDRRMLDRTHAIVRTFVTVAAVIGSANAAGWLKMPNAALGGNEPLGLLGTAYGEKRVQNLIDGLLSGAIV